MIRKGKICGDKVRYQNGIGCCIWYPFPGTEGEDEQMGIAFDVRFEDIDDLIALLRELKTAEAEIYSEE